MQRRELEYLASSMNSVELNGSFYSLQRPESYERWRDATPPGFRFAVKGSRLITQLIGSDRLQSAVDRFFDSGVFRLEDRLGPLLWQFPKTRAFDAELFERFCAALPRTHDGHRLHHAIEPRHESFADPLATRLLHKHNIALVASDGAGEWPVFVGGSSAEKADAPSDIVYVRLHGAHELYRGGYTPKELRQWASVIRDLATRGERKTARDAYIYFDNDADGRAPHDAIALADTLAR
ncbi:DUF72 domain-containing protein [Gryllotalpicola reticulitermitis]|uniref:DUF72 domain-containing protein n=1 Tax=Gryllotalpicola reticulitermitis TaxID=1184153 RepID=A0ABV8Q2G8_9MICO